MTATDVIAFLQLLQEHQIDVCIDGGWAVDALLGRQTRPHNDLDIAVDHKDVPQIRALLEARGYKEVSRDDSWECNFVLGDDQGHEIDFHSCTFDAEGNNIFGVPYPYASLQGAGSINGFPVRCVPPEWLVQFHTGYKLDENDYRDVKALCQQFGLEIPIEYGEFVANDTQSRAIIPELPARPELPEGWYYPDPDDAQRLLAELQRELPDGHLLYDLAVEVFAWREHATDDVLFRHRHQPDHFTVIHLSWLGRTEINAQHPTVEFDGSWAEFLAEEQRPRMA